MPISLIYMNYDVYWKYASNIDRKLFGSIYSQESYEQNLLIAYLIVYKLRPIGFCVCKKIGNGFQVSTLGITKRYQNKGVGTFVFESLFIHAKVLGFRNIKLLVSKKNKNAVSLYKELGFNVEKEDGGCYIMKKNIYK